MRRFCLFLVFVFVCLVAGCVLVAAAVAADPVEITNWGDMPPYPTAEPHPTQVPMPTVCVTVVAGNVCGLAAIPVAHANGEGGYQLAILGVLLVGFGSLFVLHLAGLFYGGKGKL